MELDNIPIFRTTYKRKKKEDGKYSSHRVQGRCQVCYTGQPTTYCSLLEDRDGDQIFFVIHGVEEIVLRNIMNLNMHKIETTMLCNSIFFIMYYRDLCLMKQYYMIFAVQVAKSAILMMLSWFKMVYYVRE